MNIPWIFFRAAQFILLLSVVVIYQIFPRRMGSLAGIPRTARLMSMDADLFGGVAGVTGMDQRGGGSLSVLRPDFVWGSLGSPRRWFLKTNHLPLNHPQPNPTHNQPPPSLSPTSTLKPALSPTHTTPHCTGADTHG